MQVIPVFIFKGFLNSGKTTLIKDIIEGEKGYQNNRTLIISFEDGEESYSDEWKKKYKVNVEFIEDEEKYDNKYLNALVKKYKPKQIVFELNAFFDFNVKKLPYNFEVYQQIVLFETKSFELYYNNMKPLINGMVNNASLVVFNRSQGDYPLSKYRRFIKAFNQNVQIAFENSNGKLSTILNEDLPYDINSDHFEVKKDDFPVWYLDMTESFDKYKGKTITFEAYIRLIEEDDLVIGRQIMTCCVDDIQFFGFECLTKEPYELNSLVRVTGKPKIGFSKAVNGNVVQFEDVEIKVLDYVDEEYLTFS